MDELQKALARRTTSSVNGVGEGTGERGIFVYNKETQQMERFVKKSRSHDNASATIIRDEMLDGVESPLTGEKYYSRSALLKHYKENGYRVTGGDHFTHKLPEVPKANYDEIREDVEKALNDIRWGNVPISEQERQRIMEEERQWNQYRERQKY